MKKSLYSLCVVLLLGSLPSFSQGGYQVPPPAIADLVEAPLPPAVQLNATRDWMLLMEQPGYPSIEELAEPELRLAGLRINPRTNGPSRSGSYNGLQLKNIQTLETYPIQGLPENPRISNLSWAADGQRFAFTHTHAQGIELWVAEVGSRRARRLSASWLSDAMPGMPYRWVGNDRLLAKFIPADRGAAPAAPLAPAGPVIQESQGEKTTLRTYQDLLQNQHDEALFEYYAQAQLYLIELADGKAQPLGPAAMVRSMSASPDGRYILVESIKKPFSYIVPFYNFPTDYDLYTSDGKLAKQVAAIPLVERLPQGFGAVREGPRNIAWRPDQPATLYWVEALDGGDPKQEAEWRDRLFFWPAPFAQAPAESIAFQTRYRGINWGDGDLAIASEFWWATRQITDVRFDPRDPTSRQVISQRSSQDRYNDPGSFLYKVNPYGQYTLLSSADGDKLYLSGQGASPEGNRPFLREYSLASGEMKELWRSEAPYYEYPVAILDADAGTVITRRESPQDPPNYFVRNWKTGSLKALTDFAHPYPALEGIEKQVVQYEREDGVGLQGDLYLPKGYDPQRDGSLPVLMWAYPVEYKSKDDAGQVQGSPYEFVRLSWGSPLYWVARGYAILDRAAMPIVGEGDAEPNDSFKKQLVANAQAAIDKLVEMGVADRRRIAVGGHSYGAFMTANLLAHSDLFAAGIARSGAYNRTLTPFGFQSEERTYWDAPEVYNTMSPFMNAHQINEPILLIHGEADNNSGTFPIQSERLYQAINGLGGTARLVMLPHESHGYRARESILHQLWEMDQWLEKYVKEAGVKP
jgi:dipeptidyl aminopeptidase/acylaminoacyl peptidase